MTLSEFANVFALLAIQLRQTDADEATIRGYFEALKDLEIEFLTMAAQRLANQNEFFPKTSELRSAAARIERDRTERLRAELSKRSEPLCRACADTGWERVGEGVRRCDCQRLRRLELLGRRPWPALPEGEPGVDPSHGDIGRTQAVALLGEVEQHTGHRFRPRGFPQPVDVRNTEDSHGP